MFRFKLARDLGMTVHELGARMSAQEETEWAIVYRLEFEAKQEAEMDQQLMSRHSAREQSR